MNVGELKATLDELNIPKRSYSINESISSDIYIYFDKYILIGNAFILMKEEIKIMPIKDLIMKVMHAFIFCKC